MSDGYGLPKREHYNHALGVATARNDSFLNDLAKRGYLHALGASVPGWPCHIPHLSHFYLGSSVENPLVKHHAVWENVTLHQDSKSTIKTSSRKLVIEQYIQYNACFLGFFGHAVQLA